MVSKQQAEILSNYLIQFTNKPSYIFVGLFPNAFRWYCLFGDFFMLLLLLLLLLTYGRKSICLKTMEEDLVYLPFDMCSLCYVLGTGNCLLEFDVMRKIVVRI